jgi:phosphoglycerate dehydrogenase-like enzyme
MRLAILDDYQRTALAMADWDGLRPSIVVHAFHDTLANQDALVERLGEFEIVVAMRERTPFLRTLLERLPNLRLLITTGMRNASIDVKAAVERGILVTGTTMLPYPTMGLTRGAWS